MRRKAQEAARRIAGVRGAGAAAILVLLAGCMGAPQDAAPASGCPLRYPDGSALDCGASAFTDAAVLPDGPAPATGWTCRDDSLADGGNRYQVWVASDGQVGVRWDLRAAPLPGQAFLLATMYQAQQDQVLLLPYQDLAFAAFPQTPSLDSPVEIHVLAYSLRAVHANTVDAYRPEHWSEVANASLRLSTFGADPWAVVEVAGAGGAAYLDLNEADLTEAGKPMWRPRGNQLHELGEDGPWYVAEVVGGGAKFPNRDPVQLRANPGFCYLEDLPVARLAASLA